MTQPAFVRSARVPSAAAARQTFSNRVPSSLAPSELATAVARARAAGTPLLDLAGSNPTVVGLDYPSVLVQALGEGQALRYEPHPFGLRSAREAVAAEYRRHGAQVPADQVILTASTSEAYSLLFKLLCDPGDEVLVPVPSYPLFEHLSRLDAVAARPYPLEYHGVWSLDLDALEHALGPRTKAVIVVAPNNPTGSYLRAGQWDALQCTCAARGVAVVADEVFLDYPLEPAPDAVQGVLGRVVEEGPLTIALGGLSKSVGLPQHKLGWMAAHGPHGRLTDALARLEFICDTYLSVSTPVQVAAPRLLAEGAGVRDAIAGRIARNLGALRARAHLAPACEVLRVEAGWSAVLRVPAIRPEERLVVDLLEQDGVVVQPGYFYDFPSEAYLVVSLLTEPGIFEEGIDRVCRRASA